MSIRIVRTLPRSSWEQFVRAHPRANVFHMPELHDVFARARGHRPELWAAVDRWERVLALLLPVQISLAGGPARIFTTRSVAYGSVLFEQDPDGRDGLRQLLMRYARDVESHVLFTELRNVSELEDAQALLQGCGFAYEEHLNFLVDLDRSPDEILQSIRTRTRKQIRRGMRSGAVTVQEVEGKEGARRCYAVLKRSYARARIPIPDRSLFDAIADVLGPAGMVKLLVARVGDVDVAASVELLYRRSIYGWYGGVDRRYASYTPNEMLMWYVLRWGAENGYQVYDFGGAGTPDEEYGVRDFKAKFGGKLVSYGRNTIVHRPRRLVWSKLGYRLYRALGRVPDLPGSTRRPRGERSPDKPSAPVP